MIIDVLTLFPNMFENVLNESILKRAQGSDKVRIRLHNLRRWTHDRHRTADDKPFGGGCGMVIKPEPIFEAVDDLLSFRGTPKAQRSNLKKSKARIVLLTPQGKKLDQKLAKRLSKHKRLILICGHYEGFDERIRKHLATDEISIGDYILTCGELPAMVLIDSVVRLLPKVLGHKDSVKSESFEDNLLEYPHYTRPAEYRGLRVPQVLLSGNHKDIEGWRKRESIARTKERRPDLMGLHKKGR